MSQRIPFLHTCFKNCPAGFLAGFLIFALVCIVPVSFLNAAPVRIPVKDSPGSTVELPGTPQRIVSLVPSAAEILVRIGAGSTLLGTTYHDVSLKDSEKRTIVGGFFNPSMARVKALNPDLVILSPIHKEISLELTSLNIPVFVYDTRDLDGAWNLMEALGRMTGLVAEAEALIRETQGYAGPCPGQACQSQG